MMEYTAYLYPERTYEEREAESIILPGVIAYISSNNDLVIRFGETPVTMKVWGKELMAIVDLDGGEE